MPYSSAYVSEIAFGHLDVPSDIGFLDDAKHEVTFPASDGFGRKSGQNRLLRISSQMFSDLNEASAKILGQTVTLVDAMAFVQTQGGGLELHADPVAVLAWQVKGRKRWRMFGQDQMPEDMRALRKVQENPDAAQILSDFYRNTSFAAPIEHELGPGDFLVMPPFTLHETHAVTDGLSVSMTITFEPVGEMV